MGRDMSCDARPEGLGEPMKCGEIERGSWFGGMLSCSNRGGGRGGGGGGRGGGSGGGGEVNQQSSKSRFVSFKGVKVEVEEVSGKAEVEEGKPNIQDMTSAKKILWDREGEDGSKMHNIYIYIYIYIVYWNS